MKWMKVWCHVVLVVSIGRWWRELDQVSSTVEEELRRDDFPKEFIFGSGTSAYQVEGAVTEDGRTPSIWDTFAHAGHLPGKSTGDIAADGYHKYKGDVKLMEEMGLEGYRFSISWSRLIPNGRGYVNPKGLEYYNNLINELIKKGSIPDRHVKITDYKVLELSRPTHAFALGIQPHVTLFHYDLPQVLEDEYQGWLNPEIVDDFTAYADVCFREYGDRVSHWTTLNEPNVFVLGGYDAGIFPPGRCSYPFGNCSHGNSVMEPYIVAHNCLLAHSSVAALYKRKYQVNQKGLVGMNIFMYHLVPKSDSTDDIIAAKRAQEFYTGWFIQPFMNGDYPATVKKIVGKKIPKFTKNQSKQLVGALDFIGVNYYFTLFVKDDPTDLAEEQRDCFADMSAKLSASLDNGKAGVEIATTYGLQGVLEYLKQAYGNPPIYVHENGFPLPHSSSLDDTPRIKYLSVHTRSLLNALRNGSNTLGYFTWSFLDLFELQGGYEASYGMYYVNFSDKQLKRYPKLSAHWYSNFLKRSSSIIPKHRSSYAPTI